MEIISKIAGGVKTFTIWNVKGVLSVNRHVETIRWIKDMSKTAFVPKQKLTLNEMQEILKQEPDSKAFQKAAREQDLSLEQQKQAWKLNLVLSYLFLTVFTVNIALVVSDFSIVHLISSVGIGMVYLMLFLTYSFRCFQLQSQSLHGIGAFLSRPTEFFPNPVWSPKVK
jgi:hypothetical protein